MNVHSISEETKAIMASILMASIILKGNQQWGGAATIAPKALKKLLEELENQK